jgi:hypothetical protein
MWDPLVVHLEVVVMFQHLTPNPYDDYEISASAEKWWTEQREYWRDYRVQHHAKTIAQARARALHARYNAGEAHRAHVLSIERERQKRYQATDEARRKRAAAQRLRRAQKRARALMEIAKLRESRRS